MEDDNESSDTDASKSTSTSGGSSTMPNHIFNLVKSIVGAGVLSLPAGISNFGNAPSAIVPAAILIAFIGSLSAYGFSLIGRVCAYTGSNSYKEAWEKSVGAKSSIIPAASCTFKTVCATLAYSMILADTFRALFQTVGFPLSRTNTLLGVTSTLLLPLCLLKNLASLAPFSLLGIIGMLYTSLAMTVRYLQGAYLPGGKFFSQTPASLQPNFGSIGAKGALSPSSFILICMLSTAYMAHFNAPKFYTELKNNTLPRFNKVVTTSFGISIAFFVLMAGLGFCTFGSASSGLILNNYSNKDILMAFSRVAVAISIVFSYPLAFSGCRDGVLDLAGVPPEKRNNALLDKVTVTMLSFITFLALKVKDLSFVLSFGGATLGNALIYVYPAIMFRAAVKKMKAETTTTNNQDGEDNPSAIDNESKVSQMVATKSLKREVKFALANAGLGIAMGGIGARMALKSVLGG
eukprot:CAMPEP_0184868978 /NCGR_PEP_ID=MMETSP0580-20130426/32403_1 /TAXON_ID=1118495 /ORGANISM="Dactyliosolen fragilissimus" /LENGTH=462 /DNA_ID=CAMNT_0027370171 /DNA_START=484 /DNA_END=1872 /DNA_ORIENTATION=-